MVLEGETNPVVVGGSFELIVLANSPEVELIEPETPNGNETPAKKKGCFGSVLATSSLFALLSVGGIALILGKRKREE